MMVIVNSLDATEEQRVKHNDFLVLYGFGTKCGPGSRLSKENMGQGQKDVTGNKKPLLKKERLS